MNKLKRTLILGAGVASIGVAGVVGVTGASALTSTDSSTGSSLIDKLVAKFNLNKSEVQAVFDAERTEHQAEMKADRETSLKAALTAGTLTQVQYDYIIKAQAEIDVLMEASGDRESQTDAQKSAIKDKMDTLRDWMKEQDLNLKDLGLGFGRGHGPGGPRDDDDDTDTSTSTTQ
jgi:predicted homoserine dehydrogenase-like protein